MPRLSKIGAAALAAFGWSSGGGAVAVTASYLVVAGGGGGGGYNAGSGGGAGGLLTGTTTLDPALSYTVLVGAGGAGGPAGVYTVASNGTSSTFDAVTTIGGGGGGSGTGTVSNGGNGGSGGGSWSGATPGSGTSGQGYAGAIGSTDSATYTNGGAGGGAGAAASAAVGSTRAGNGGIGIASSITGTSTYYAGGGGGAAQAGTQGTGGLGGGGAGTSGAGGISGTANLGGGGGGANTASGVGGRGGSGVVIIAYAGAQQFGGGIVTTDGTNTIHTFTTSGTLAPLSSLTADYLIVAGGAGGGWAWGGGGGAGGMQTGSGVTIDTNSTYLVTVGAGGTGGTSSSGSGLSGNGTNSAFSMVTTSSVGGGGGGPSAAATVRNGADGGSGGGGWGSGATGQTASGGSATSGQGNAGGGVGGITNAGGGGGGGAGSAGTASVNGGGTASAGGAGGNGLASSISGSSVTYAGGGGGGTNALQVAGGVGGTGGGGTGGGNQNGGIPTAGTANLGAGGGGGGYNGSNVSGANGGSGIVIISYAGSVQQMAGGTVTITGGNVIHTFTSSGYLTPLTFVGNSLRFRASNSAYLSRTPTTAGSRTTWTFSAWVKRGNLSLVTGAYGVFGCAPGGAEDTIRFDSATAGNQINFYVYTGGYVGQLNTTASYRDPAAWYHLVCVWDTTNATSTERMRLYVNGVRVTAFGTATYPSLNAVSNINNSVATQIGWYSPSGTGYYDGEMTEINFIDGQALTPNSFGTFNSYGVWQPITYGGSYGTNGFYLPFNGNRTSTYGGYTSDVASNYVNLPTGSQGSNFTFTGDFTIEAWVNIPASAADNSLYVEYDGSSFFAFNISMTAGIYNIYLNSGSPNTITHGILANTWTHVAMVRSGSTVTLYTNGVPKGTITNSGTLGYSTLTLNRFGGGGGGARYTSNVRIVKSAVYTSAFTPPTSLLTNIANTVVLTFQDSTFIDNSSNNYTLTQTGTTTLSVQYPFNTFTYSDQGPAGNNWTPNNLSQINDSTMDLMTDVPTLTSTTAANYATLNPLSTTSGTYSAGNLQFVGANAWKSALSTIQIPTTGKWYWESTIIGTVYTPRSSGTGNNATGILPATTFDSTTNPNTSTSGLFILDSGYIKNFSTAIADMGSAFVNGDVIGVAIDTTNNTYEFFKNNTSVGSGTINNTAGTPYVAVLASYYGTYSPFAINFGQRPFAYTPPAGFVALNTYNM